MRPHPTIHLNTGAAIPVLGLGVYQLKPGEPARQAVRWALEAGYRHIDTASFYGNETDVGQALRESGLRREEVFLTTKLWPTDFLRPAKALKESLRRLGTDHLDLYLVHWPFVGRDRAWKALEQAYADGLVRAIGVSNYSIKQLEDLFRKASVVPAVNQIEVSPFLTQTEVRAFCQAKGIVVEAYSPLTRGKKLLDARIASIANAHERSSAQVLIRWSLQHGLVPLPKSAKRERIIENAAVFDFTLHEEEMRTLDGLNVNYSALF